MLENDYSVQITGLLSNLACNVLIPPEWGDYLSKEGVLPSIENDRRRFARKHFRTKAVLEIKPTIPAIDRQQEIHAVYTRDMSRDGLSFLHVSQLYPGEACRLWLPDRRLPVDVVRCSRVNSRCYIVAGTYT